MSNLRSWSKGDQHRKQRKMLNLVFSTAHMREMSMYCFFLLDKPAHWCSSSDILWSLLQGTRVIYLFYFVVYSNIILSKLRAAFAHRVKDGSREVYTFRLLIRILFYFVICLSLDWSTFLVGSHSARIDRPKWAGLLIWSTNRGRRSPSILYCG